MSLTEDQILTLAPDEASKKAGKELANPAKWVTKGAAETAVWGECQGSGSKPYQTGIDLRNLAFKCSCPSRKFPCKHGIALGLLYARQAASFGAAEAPAWLSEWLGKRTEKDEKKEEKKDKPVDEAAQAKRLQAREGKVAAGVEELLLWIKDIVRGGIINLPDKPYAFWDGAAKRMVDAQASGLANGIKALGATPFYREGWQSGFLDGLLNLYLLAKSYQNRSGLSPLLVQDLRTLIGFTVSQEELKAQAGVVDNWLVVGKQVSEEDAVTVERYWLYGLASRRYALVLQFLVRGQGATLLLSPGLYLEAELVFYPAVSPLRAVIKRQTTTAAVAPSFLYASWTEVAQAETEICSALPLRTERPYALKALTPVYYNNGWWLKDEQHNLTNVKEGFAGIYKLLALSGGAPLDTVVLGREQAYQPLGVWVNEIYKPI